MFFQHVYDKTLAQASYFIGCQQAGVAIVIDPKRDVDTYLKIAGENKMKITHIAETHIHADFLSGSRELQALTGAELYLSDEGGKDWQYEFPHVALKDGSTFMLGNLKFEVIHTPGHTPESISFLLTDTPASKEPVMIFTGDFIFVGDVGRPDLLEEAAGLKGTKEVGAKQMYRSIERVRQLPDHIQLWPGHGAGSACGKSLGAVPSSTIGYEKIRNWAFQYENDEQGFISYLLEDQPEPPRYFAMMKQLNKVDRPLLTEVPTPRKLSKEEFRRAMTEGIKVIDTRKKLDFAAGYIPGTLNIQNNNSFATWMGWLVSYDEPFILIAEDEEMDKLVRMLMRIGLDNLYGYIPNVNVWQELGNELETEEIVSQDEFKELLQQEDVQVVDLRGATEYKEGHLEGADHVFVGTLEENLDKISKDRKVVIHCQAGDRAAIGYSILAKHGFDKVVNYLGGYADWVSNDNPVVREEEPALAGK
jgi:hydroxyacylglutathione hydrolase